MNKNVVTTITKTNDVVTIHQTITTIELEDRDLRDLIAKKFEAEIGKPGDADVEILMDGNDYDVFATLKITRNEALS